MLQLTPPMRVLFAVEPIDGRKGIDSLAALCRQKLGTEGTLSGCVFIFRTGTSPAASPSCRPMIAPRSCAGCATPRAWKVPRRMTSADATRAGGRSRECTVRSPLRLLRIVLLDIEQFGLLN